MHRRLFTAGLLSLPMSMSARAATTPITVFAAASLTDALNDAGTAWTKADHVPVRFSFGASSTLARQIEQGAPADMFASADEKWMDYLATRGLIVPGTRRDLLSNTLVLIVPTSHPVRVTIGPGFDLMAILGTQGRLATGDPRHVPVGIYAEQALKHLGIWDQVQPRLAPAADVRSALLLVERGEAPAGIVYATDAAVSKNVMIAGVFPPDTHPPITYPFAIVKGGDSPAARAFLQFLSGPSARTIFKRYGFGTEIG
ncbi:MAG: molybdate ABC transporter substrate-binding protein [Acetobacteraceae bacterium]